MKKTYLLLIIAFYTLYSSQLIAQNTGIGEPNPASKLSVKGNMSIGDTYSGIAGPTGGLIIEGAVGLGTSTPDVNAVLDMSSTSKGMFLPRLSRAQRLAISNPSKGLMVFDTDSNTIFFHNGTTWFNFPAVDLVNNTVVGATSNIFSGTTGPTGPQGEGYGSTSVTTATIGTGNKTIVTQNNQAYQPNDRVRISANSSNYMEGLVISYANQTLTVNVSRTLGSGTYSNWMIGIVGDPGATGVTGATGATGAAGVNGAVGATGATGAAGVQGATGATGPQGIQGPAGSNGATGATGTTGATGPTGADGLNGDMYATTSTTSNTIGTGSKTFTVGTGLDYTIAQPVIIANTTANTMTGTVTSYNSTTGVLVVNVTSYTGSGTKTSWSINLGGIAGPTGATGATGSTGSNGATGATGPQGPQGVAGTNGATGATGPQGPAGATGTISGLTNGQVVYGSPTGGASQTNTFYWDASNSRLGVGTNSPANTFSVGSSSQFQLDNSGNLSISSSGSVTVASLATGQLIFPNSSGRLIQNNNLFWDNSNSRLGVGTNSPANTFSVGSSSQFQLDNSGNLSISSSGSVTVASLATGQLIFPNSSGRLIQNNNLFWDNSNSRLGVGSSSPQNLFSVGSSSQFQVNSSGDIVKIKNVAYSFPSSQASANQVLTNDGSGNLSWAAPSNSTGWLLTGNSGTTPGTNYIGTNDNNDLVFKTNGTEKVRIQTNGLMGIGCQTVPTNKWIVASSLAAPTFTSAANGFGACFPGGAGFYVKNSTDNVEGKYESYSGKVHIGVASNVYAPLVFYTEGNTESARLDANGYFGIGSTAPAQKLDVADGNIIISNNGTAGMLMFEEPSASGSNYTAFKAGAQSGNVTYTLPAADGSSGQFLSTNGSGTLSWASAATGSYINNSSSAQAGANFNVGGNGTIGGALSVGGSSALSGSLSVSGAATLSSTLGVTGATTLSSTLGVSGLSTLTGGAALGASLALPITTTNSNLTLTASHYTVIITGSTPTITLPAASGAAGRVYVIVNQTGAARTISSYRNMAGTATTSVAATNSIIIQSDGTNWYQIK